MVAELTARAITSPPQMSRTSPITSNRAAGAMRNWCEQYGIGRRIGNGHWEVSRVALQMFLDGDRNALACYHRNNRDPVLMGYFEHVGLGCLVG
jgi:hypothetical protein